MTEQTKVVLARWQDRFLAWLIDFLLISISFGTIFLVTDTLTLEWNERMFLTKSAHFVPTSFIFFVYWSILEHTTSQSIGKRVLSIKVAKIDGKKASLKGVLISSFGKSFLLPLDVFLGLILTNEKRQRIFNKIGDTIVIKSESRKESSDTPQYIKD